jgi:hypothetical protein
VAESGKEVRLGESQCKPDLVRTCLRTGPKPGNRYRPSDQSRVIRLSPSLPLAAEWRRRKSISWDYPKDGRDALTTAQGCPDDFDGIFTHVCKQAAQLHSVLIGGFLARAATDCARLPSAHGSIYLEAKTSHQRREVIARREAGEVRTDIARFRVFELTGKPFFGTFTKRHNP